MNLKSVLFILLFLACNTKVIAAEEVNYELEFRGPLTPVITNTLTSVSQLHLLQKDSLHSRIALRRRAEADLPNLIHGLHSLGFYNAKVELNILDDEMPAKVVIDVEPGTIYPLNGFKIEFTADSESLLWIQPSDLGLRLGRPALPKAILEAVAELLLLLAEEGYPLATIKKQRVVADQKEKALFVELVVDPGQKVVFGATEFVGLKNVLPSYLFSKLAWKRGWEYDPLLIARTQLELESTGLFSAIAIQHGEEVGAGNELPLFIQLTEAQHRTIGFGVSYSTYLGPGALFNWENRNMQGMGRRLGMKAELTVTKQTGSAEYVVPNFFERCQQLKWAFMLDKERTEGYSETYFSVAGMVERRMAERYWLSYGLGYKQLYSSRSDNNRSFHLLKTPIHFRWNGADKPLSPTSGGTVNFKTIPTAEIIKDHFGYVINQVTGTAYWPIYEDSFVLAFKATCGSILGASRINIPPPERFYAGSENTLRGYKYMTVSPLDLEGKPIGGRSLMVYSLESRFKLKKNLGWAFFYEIGNVYSNQYPQFDSKQLQSFGCGIRYCTAVGPLRADIAFPLNRRDKIDRGFQFYISIGEAF